MQLVAALCMYLILSLWAVLPVWLSVLSVFPVCCRTQMVFCLFFFFFQRKEEKEKGKNQIVYVYIPFYFLFSFSFFGFNRVALPQARFSFIQSFHS